MKSDNNLGLEEEQNQIIEQVAPTGQISKKNLNRVINKQAKLMIEQPAITQQRSELVKSINKNSLKRLWLGVAIALSLITGALAITALARPKLLNSVVIAVLGTIFVGIVSYFIKKELDYRNKNIFEHQENQDTVKPEIENLNASEKKYLNSDRSSGEQQSRNINKTKEKLKNQPYNAEERKDKKNRRANRNVKQSKKQNLKASIGKNSFEEDKKNQILKTQFKKTEEQEQSK